VRSGYMDSAEVIEVEVVYALPHEQVVARVELPAAATVQTAIVHSRLLDRYPGIAKDIQQSGNIGVFGKPATLDTPLKAFDRVEIYRTLTVDPKEARRRRARLRAVKAKQKGI